MKINEILTAVSLPPMMLSLAMVCSAGCQNKEKVLDVETPGGGGVEIERDRDTGAVDVDVQRKGERKIEIDTPGADVEISRDRDGGKVEVE